MTLNIKLKRSASKGSAPTAGQLQDGELGLNYNADSLALYCKDTDGDIRQIAGKGGEGSHWDLSGSTLSPDDNAYSVDIGNGEIVLGADGNVAITGKATSASTTSTDSATTLATKGYVDSHVPATVAPVISQDTAPDFIEDYIWFDSRTADAYVGYKDPNDDEYWVSLVKVGPPGQTGSSGPQGDQGLQGDRGPQGDPGPETYATVSDNPPASPEDGEIWVNSTSGKFYSWWNSQSVWVSS